MVMNINHFAPHPVPISDRDQLGWNARQWAEIARYLQDLVAEGTWTPARTNVSNVAAASSPPAYFTRVGTHVRCFGRFAVTATVANEDTWDGPTAGSETVIRMSLPVRSNLSELLDLAGSIQSEDGRVAGVIVANSSDDTALVRWYPITTASTNYYFAFSYKVL